jgi:hypothetical protein
MIRLFSRPENREKEQNLLIEWGKFRSMGEGFAFVGSDVKKLVIFQRIGGPCRDRTYDQLIKSQLLYQLS